MKNFKITLENSLNLTGINSNTIIRGLGQIIQDIMTSTNRDEIKYNLELSNKYHLIDHFIFGFGGSHLWVKQLDKNNNSAAQIILVEFINN